MIALEEAQSRLLALAEPVDVEVVPLSKANGRWLYEPLIAMRTQPARCLSAMDGYAVRAIDGPEWRLIGESAAGCAYRGAVGAGEAVRIFTGAVVPEGADCVVLQEDVDARDGLIRLTEPNRTEPGDHIRRAGSDFREGDVLADKGNQINAATVALAAMAGHATLRLCRPIKVALISTGDELVPPGSALREDQIPATNGLMLAAMLDGLPLEIWDPGIIPDKEDAIRTALNGARGSDIIVTLGGASVGDHDLVRPALLAEGAALDFWKVAMRPGKPVMAGRLGDALVLGLPGNPVSAYVTTHLFLLPLVRQLSGARNVLPELHRARLAVDLPENGPRVDHRRGILTKDGLAPVGANDSAMLASLSRTTALIVRPPHAPAAKAGDMTDYIPVN